MRWNCHIELRWTDIRLLRSFTTTQQNKSASGITSLSSAMFLSCCLTRPVLRLNKLSCPNFSMLNFSGCGALVAKLFTRYYTHESTLCTDGSVHSHCDRHPGTSGGGNRLYSSAERFYHTALCHENTCQKAIGWNLRLASNLFRARTGFLSSIITV